MLAVVTIVVEVMLAVALWFPALRLVTAATGITLHASFLVFLLERWEFLSFGLLCVVVYPLFASWRPGERPHTSPPAPASPTTQ